MEKPIKIHGSTRIYEPETGDRICEMIATTTIGINRILAADSAFPSMKTFLKWCDANPSFAHQYARAKSQQMDMIAEEIMEISDRENADVYIEYDKDGKPTAKMDGSAIQRSKLQVDTRRWLMSKLAPKKYGDKLDITSAGDALGGAGQLSPAERAARATGIASAVKARVIEHQPSVKSTLDDMLD